MQFAELHKGQFRSMIIRYITQFVIMLLLFMLGIMIYNVHLSIALVKAAETTKKKEAINGEEGSVSD